MNKKKFVPLALGMPLLLGASAPAYAAEDTQTFQATLTELNDSGTSAMAVVEVDGGQVDVTLNVSGAVAGAPHAQHIHIGGEGVCPTMEADTNGDGIVSTPEGAPAYGPVRVSLTTEGDTSPESVLAVKRFPVGESYMYERSIDISDKTARDISDGMASVVVHGIDTNGNGKYDDSAGPSPLNSDLPLEATAPAACGELMPAPVGGMEAGSGGAAGQGFSTGLLGLGGAFIVAAAGGLFATLRSRRTTM